MTLSAARRTPLFEQVVGQLREQITQRWAQGRAGVRLGTGVGLGLAIASRYAALMNGTLELKAGPDGRGLCAVLEVDEAATASSGPTVARTAMASAEGAAGARV